MNPPLSEETLLAMHQSSLRVLCETGFMIDDKEATQLLCAHGAWVKRGRLCLPPQLIENCLQDCPKEVVLQGRAEKITLGDGGLYVHNMGGARDVYELTGGRLRPATCRDVAESTLLMDALENVSSITPLYTPRDVPPALMAPAMFDQVVRHTTKPINGPGVSTPEEVKVLSEMARVVFGDHPAVSLGASPVSPLNFLGPIPQVIMEIARQGLPFGPLPCPNVGATAPMSLAGAIVLQNAELLVCLVLAHLVHPGLPIIYCGRLSVLNMRNGAPLWGNPEVGMMAAATVRLGHHYRLPVNVYGLAGSGFAPDMQSGYERAINAFLPALAGADELSGIGEMAGGVYSCNVQILIDNDIIGAIRRVLRGFPVDDEALAVEAIEQAMESRRDFMRSPHTRKYLRNNEVWAGRLGLQESGWESWSRAGARTILDRAHYEAQRLLEQHQVPSLPDEQIKALDEIMKSTWKQVEPG